MNGILDENCQNSQHNIRPRRQMSSSPVYIMWTRCGSLQHRQTWTPNHFVPLLEVTKLETELYLPAIATNISTTQPSVEETTGHCNLNFGDFLSSDDTSSPPMQGKKAHKTSTPREKFASSSTSSPPPVWANKGRKTSTHDEKYLSPVCIPATTSTPTPTQRKSNNLVKLFERPKSLHLDTILNTEGDAFMVQDSYVKGEDSINDFSLSGIPVTDKPKLLLDDTFDNSPDVCDDAFEAAETSITKRDNCCYGKLSSGTPLTTMQVMRILSKKTTGLHRIPHGTKGQQILCGG